MRDRPVRAAGSTVSELLVGPEPPPVPICWHVKQDKPKFGERRGSRGVTPVALPYPSERTSLPLATAFPHPSMPLLLKTVPGQRWGC